MYNLHSSYIMKLDQADNFITHQDLLKIKEDKSQNLLSS